MKEKLKPKKIGRPSAFTQEVADRICERLIEGESLRKVCDAGDMPHKATVCRWLADEERKDFREQYTRAREEQADTLADQIVGIADEEVTMVRRSKHQPGANEADDTEENEVEVIFDPTAVARNRLRVDARKWYASKLAPKKYGDKVAIGGASDLPPLQTAAVLTDEQLMAIAATHAAKS